MNKIKILESECRVLNDEVNKLERKIEDTARVRNLK
jgi:hypothetical protein